MQLTQAIPLIVEVADNDAFTNKIAQWTGAEQPSQTALDIPVDLAHSKVYYWHVRAYDPTTLGPFSLTRAFATPALPLRDTSAPALSRRLSISVSTRETKNEATDSMPARLASGFSSSRCSPALPVSVTSAEGLAMSAFPLAESLMSFTVRPAAVRLALSAETEPEL